MQDSLLLAPGTAIVCPHCDKGFSVEQGFAKHALEQIASVSAQGIDQLKARERAAAERRAQESSAERELLANTAAEQLREQLSQQAAVHAASLREAAESAELAAQTKIARLETQLAQSHSRLATIDEREADLLGREQTFTLQVQQAAQQAAAQLVETEKHAYEEQLRHKDLEVAKMRTAELTLRKEKALIEDRTAALELEVARKLDAGRGEIEAKIRAQEQQRSGLREAELQKTIADMREKVSEAQRKADQGSQQLQGEVLELAIEDGLRRTFPLDKIEEVKKGVRGGDVLQRVLTRAGQFAGILLWETKRAKDWSPQWLAKLKEDMRLGGAEVGVLVTSATAVPKDWAAGQAFGLCEGVWVCTWSVALQLAEVLRSGIIDCHKQRLISAGKGEKLEAVYDYLTSPHFGNKLRAVFEAFEKMREELESEKNQAQQRWARREKQLQSGMTCLLAIGGEIQGLAQQGLPELELSPFKLVAQ
jgi:hypothetical protein